MGKSKKNIYELAKEEYINTQVSVTKISVKYKIDRGRFAKYLSQQGIVIVNRQNVQAINCDYFQTIDSEEKAYWLGFLFADGYVSYKTNHIELSLQINDLNHLRKFAKAINFTNKIIQDNFRCRICFACKKMKIDLINKGCLPRKSLTLNPPKDVPFNLLKHFIRGYFDGDGCICCSKKPHIMSVSVLGTYNFLEFYRSFLYLAHRTLTPNKGSENTFVLKISGETARRFVIYLYCNSTIHLDRKYLKYLNLKIALQDRKVLDALTKYGRKPVKENTVVNC